MKKICVIVVDEQEIFREGIRRVLDNEKDIQCLSTFGSLEELKLYINRSMKDSIPDLLLVAMTVIKREGKEIITSLKKRFPNLRVAALTHLDGDLFFATALSSGLSGYLLKTTSLHDLIESIRLINHGLVVLDEKVSSNILTSMGKQVNPSLMGFCGLRERECQVLSLAASGMSNKRIAQSLCISPHTVSSHFAHIFQKLSVESRTEAIALSLQRGWLDSERIQYLANGARASKCK